MSPAGSSVGAIMTKSQLIALVAQKAPHVPPKRVEAIVNAVFESMTQALRAGERIELRGFGCFAVKSRPARLGRNPKTGAPVQLTKRAVIAFSAGKELRERLNREFDPLQGGAYLPERWRYRPQHGMCRAASPA